jgi:hypothetical protein
MTNIIFDIFHDNCHICQKILTNIKKKFKLFKKLIKLIKKFENNRNILYFV